MMSFLKFFIIFMICATSLRATDWIDWETKRYENSPASYPPLTQPPSIIHTPTPSFQAAQYPVVVTAPWVGKVVEILVTPGQLVRKNDVLLVINTGRAEHTIRAVYDGRVELVLPHLDKIVAVGEPILQLMVPSAEELPQTRTPNFIEAGQTLPLEEGPAKRSHEGIAPLSLERYTSATTATTSLLRDEANTVIVRNDDDEPPAPPVNLRIEVYREPERAPRASLVRSQSGEVILSLGLPAGWDSDGRGTSPSLPPVTPSLPPLQQQFSPPSPSAGAVSPSFGRRQSFDPRALPAENQDEAQRIAVRELPVMPFEAAPYVPPIATDDIDLSSPIFSFQGGKSEGTKEFLPVCAQANILHSSLEMMATPALHVWPGVLSTDVYARQESPTFMSLLLPIMSATLVSMVQENSIQALAFSPLENKGRVLQENTATISLISAPKFSITVLPSSVGEPQKALAASDSSEKEGIAYQVNSSNFVVADLFQEFEFMEKLTNRMVGVNFDRYFLSSLIFQPSLLRLFQPLDGISDSSARTTATSTVMMTYLTQILAPYGQLAAAIFALALFFINIQAHLQRYPNTAPIQLRKHLTFSLRIS